jgi:hypothetical protein
MTKRRSSSKTENDIKRNFLIAVSMESAIVREEEEELKEEKNIRR